MSALQLLLLVFAFVLVTLHAGKVTTGRVHLGWAGVAVALLALIVATF